MSEDQNRPISQEQLSILIEKKTRIVQQLLKENVQPLPGVLALIRSAQEQKIPLAISSGALMNEIRLASQCIGVWEAFTVAVSAEDVAHSKPDPESYRKAISRLSEKIGRSINPARSFAIEDSPAGIASARGAGLNVLAVTSSYPAEELQKAQRVVTSLEEITPADLDAMLE
jgi:beta-phosphoglucomutase